LLWHRYAYDDAGNRLKKLYDGEQSGDQYDYAYDGLNQLTAVSATGTPGDRSDVTGTVTDENLSAVTVYNTTLVGEFEAQLRKDFFIARAVDLAVGDNDLYALAEDKAGNEERYPQDPGEYHTVTLEAPPTPPALPLEHVYDENGCLVEIKQGETTLNEYAYDYERRLIEAKHDGARSSQEPFAPTLSCSGTCGIVLGQTDWSLARTRRAASRWTVWKSGMSICCPKRSSRNWLTPVGRFVRGASGDAHATGTDRPRDMTPDQPTLRHGLPRRRGAEVTARGCELLPRRADVQAHEER